MAELVDALVSGTSERKFVEVRVLFWAPFIQRVAVESSRSEGIEDGALQIWSRLRARWPRRLIYFIAAIAVNAVISGAAAGR